MGKRANPALVGAFVVGAVVLAVVAVALFGSGRLFRKTYPYVVYFTGDVNGLKEGAPVKFKGVEVGSVTEIRLNVSDLSSEERTREQGEIRIPVIIELDETSMREKGGKGTADAKSVKRWIELGMRAQLSMESFVTGLLYVKLDMHPGSPAHLVGDPTVKYAEIPAIPTPLEEVQAQAAQFFAKLKDLDVKGLVDSLAGTAAGLNELVNSPRLVETVNGLPATQKKLEGVFDQLDATLQSVRKLSDQLGSEMRPVAGRLEATAKDAGEALQTAKTTLEHVNALLQADSPVIYEFSRSLTDLSAAARAIRRFAEEIERNPGMLLRGKAVSQEAQ